MKPYENKVAVVTGAGGTVGEQAGQEHIHCLININGIGSFSMKLSKVSIIFFIILVKLLRLFDCLCNEGEHSTPSKLNGSPSERKSFPREFISYRNILRRG